MKRKEEREGKFSKFSMLQQLVTDPAHLTLGAVTPGCMDSPVTLPVCAGEGVFRIQPPFVEAGTNR